MSDAPSIKFTMKNEAQLKNNFNKYGRKLTAVIRTILDSTFTEMVNYAKENAVWIDRTGDARNSITSKDLSSGKVLRFYLTIGVDYGIWLEVANGGKYQILRPTMTIYEPRIMKLFERVGIKLTKGRMVTEGFRK